MSEPFHRIRGPIFEQAKAKLESVGPETEYMASAIYATEDCFFAAFAVPGGMPHFVYSEDGQGPSVFRDPKTAEARAREELFNMLNANLRDGV